MSQKKKIKTLSLGPKGLFGKTVISGEKELK